MMPEQPPRLYHVVVKYEATGFKAYMTLTPVTHAKACTILAKLTRHPWRVEMLEECPPVKTHMGLANHDLRAKN